MKKILIIATMASLLSADQNIDKMKAKIIDRANQRISIIQNGISCVKAANSKEEIKNCKEKEKQLIEQLKQEQLQAEIEKENNSHQERIAILEKADQCIKNAKTQAEYSNCERIERESRKELAGK